MKRIVNCRRVFAALAFALITSINLASAFAQKETTDPDFETQGEYTGELGSGGEATKFGLQVIALGKGKFKAVGYHGGLPGAGWNGETPVRPEGIGERNGDSVTFKSDLGIGTIRNGEMTVTDLNGNPLGTLTKTKRESHTLNQKPPAKAVVLFDGKNAEQWENGKVTEDGLLQQGTTSKQKFGSHQLHIEFQLPFQPEASGQGRGNSGIYLQGRYEVQMLDSFGLEGKDNECGGIYSVGAPALNMCLPPMSWQTYDITFTAAKYDGEKIVSNPRVTVYHNGVKIHDNVELPGDRSTTAAPTKPGPEPGPIYLQDHGNPVRYRNIWVLETDK
ncbi:MAG: DUF1080 domain-containing protein [Pirellulaceae bacterium]